MSDIDERYQRITGEFTARVRAVPLGAWDNPSPCEGWTARDVVGHLTGWIPGFFGAHGVEFPPVPSVQDDPVAAWETVQATLAEALTDPALAARPVETPFSTQSLAETVDMIVTGDGSRIRGISPAPPGRTRRLTPPSSNEWSLPWERCRRRPCGPTACSGRRSRSPPTPTTRPSFSPTSAGERSCGPPMGVSPALQACLSVWDGDHYL
jgi:hypothetical protein